MLKKRIIPVQLLLDNRLVKTKIFDKFMDVGDPIKSSKIYNDSDADELIFLNIERFLLSSLVMKISCLKGFLFL